MVVHTYSYNIIYTVFLAIVHVVREHLLNFRLIKLPGSAKSKKERIVKPGVFSNVTVCDPLLKLHENFKLFVRHVVEVSTRMRKTVELTLMAFYPYFFLFSFLLNIL